MNKLKYIIPLFGSVAVTATAVPLMVSCNKKIEVQCDAQKKLDVHHGDTFLVNCHYTGKLKPVEVEKEKLSIFDVSVYEDGQTTESSRLDVLPVEEQKPSDTTKKWTMDYIDENGDFSFKLYVNSTAEINSKINFQLRILILDANGIFRQTIDGFSWTVIYGGQ